MTVSVVFKGNAELGSDSPWYQALGFAITRVRKTESGSFMEWPIFCTFADSEDHAWKIAVALAKEGSPLVAGFGRNKRTMKARGLTARPTVMSWSVE